MILDILILLIGFALLIEGANLLIEGSVCLARKYSISHTIIGLTIIAAGTSAPEYAVSFIGALSDKSNISVGNVIGSNILNIGFVLGLIALISPLKIKTREIKFDILFLIFIGIILILMAINNVISHIEGVILLIGFIYYIYLCYKRRKASVEEILPEPHKAKTLKIVLFIIGGIIGLTAGGKITVYSAEQIARLIGVSDTIISLSIVALGTSLPELITSIIASIKKQAKISVGNIVGSNIFNLLFCLGSAATAVGLKFSFKEIKIDVAVMLLFSIILYPIVMGNKIKRFEGAILLGIYILYIIFLYS